MPWLQGAYFYGDWVHNTIGSFRYTGGDTSDLTDWTPSLQPEIGEINGLVSFGKDAAGELYVVSMRTGSVFQITRPYLVWLGQYFSAAEIADPSVSWTCGLTGLRILFGSTRATKRAGES